MALFENKKGGFYDVHFNLPASEESSNVKINTILEVLHLALL